MSKLVSRSATASAGNDSSKRIGRDRRMPLAFLLKFIGFIAAFYLITMLPWFQQQIFRTNLQASASAAAAILRALGQDARSEDTAVVSSRFALDIRRGCEAIEPAALFVAGVLAFPAMLSRKMLGIVVGVAFILVLNLVRVITLYYTGVHAPQYFEILHLDIWQTVFIISIMALWLVWAWHASGRAGLETTNATPPP